MKIQQIDDTMSVTGQITVDDLARIKEMGFKSLVCARPDNEDYGQPAVDEIARAAAELGLDVVHVPVQGPPTPENAEAFRKHWQELAKPVLGYCRSGARAGVLWSLLESAQ